MKLQETWKYRLYKVKAIFLKQFGLETSIHEEENNNKPSYTETKSSYVDVFLLSFKRVRTNLFDIFDWIILHADR